MQGVKLVNSASPLPKMFHAVGNCSSLVSRPGAWLVNNPGGSVADLGKGGRRRHLNCTHNTYLKGEFLH